MGDTLVVIGVFFGGVLIGVAGLVLCTFPWRSHGLRSATETATSSSAGSDDPAFAADSLVGHASLSRPDASPIATRLVALLDSTDVPIMAMDLAGSITFWNRGAEKLFGYRSDEVLGFTCHMLAGKGVYDRLAKHVMALSVGKEVRFDDAIGRTKAGRFFPMRIVLAGIRNEEEQLVGISNLFDDITLQRATERSLRESQERLALAVDGGNLGVWDWHVPCGHLAVNESFSRIVGRPHGSGRLAARRFQALVHPDDRGDFARAFRAACEARGEYALEFRMRRGNGAWVWVASRGKVFERGADGRAIRILGTLQDVSFRKVAERDRSLNFRRVELINQLAGCERWSLNESLGTIVRGAVELSESRSGFFGILSDGRIQATESVPESDRVPFSVAASSDDRFCPHGDALAKIAETHQPVIIGDVRAPGGDDADATRESRRLLAVPVLDRERVVAVAAVAGKSTDYADSDVQQLTSFARGAWQTIQQREDEERRRRIFERLAHVNRLQDELLLPASLDAKLQKISDAAVDLLQLGFCRTWVLGPADRCEAGCPHGERRSLGECCRGDTCLHLASSSGLYTHRDGSHSRVPLDASGARHIASALDRRIYLEQVAESAFVDREWARRLGFESFIAYPLVTEENTSAGVIGGFARAAVTKEDLAFLDSLARTGSNVLIDHRAQTKLREARAAAEAANDAKSAFLANMSHEIRTPLTAILGFADLLADASGPDETRTAAETIRRNGQYLLSMINDILDLSKVEADQLQIADQATDLPQLLRDVCSLLEVRARARNLDLWLESVGPVPASIRTDPIRLKQILVNLIANAIKFTEQGSIVLRAIFLPAARDGEEDELQLAVIDSGIGIAREDHERLFQPFVQIDSHASRRCGGTGLGLAISRKLVQRLGGRLTVESECGVGSTFTVRLAVPHHEDVPLVDLEPGAPCDAPAPDVGSVSVAGLHILLAEDGPDNQRLIRQVLEKAGATLQIAENGQEALDQWVESPSAGPPPDCILMDMQMPILDGYEATRRLRGAGIRTPIIALTAHAMAGDRRKCLDAGCDEYMTKPVNRCELLETIARIVPSVRDVAPQSPPTNPA